MPQRYRTPTAAVGCLTRQACPTHARAPAASRWMVLASLKHDLPALMQGLRARCEAP